MSSGGHCIYDATGGYACVGGATQRLAKGLLVEPFFASSSFPSPQDRQDQIMMAAAAAQSAGTTQMIAADGVRKTADASRDKAESQIIAQDSAWRETEKQEQAALSADAQNAAGQSAQAASFVNNANSADTNFFGGLQQTRLMN